MVELECCFPVSHKCYLPLIILSSRFPPQQGQALGLKAPEKASPSSIFLCQTKPMLWTSRISLFLFWWQRGVFSQFVCDTEGEKQGDRQWWGGAAVGERWGRVTRLRRRGEEPQSLRSWAWWEDMSSSRTSTQLAVVSPPHWLLTL